MTDELRQLEECLLQPEFRRNRAAVDALLADDFTEFGSSGRAFTKQEILTLLETETPILLRLADFRAHVLAPDVALVVYRSVRPDGPPTPGAAFLRSSLWVRREGRWQMLFHQGTPIAPFRQDSHPSSAG